MARVVRALPLRVVGALRLQDVRALRLRAFGYQKSLLTGCRGSSTGDNTCSGGATFCKPPTERKIVKCEWNNFRGRGLGQINNINAGGVAHSNMTVCNTSGVVSFVISETPNRKKFFFKKFFSQLGANKMQLLRSFG